MLAHGSPTGALFLLVGMLYDFFRAHTFEISEYGGLATPMPRTLRVLPVRRALVRSAANLTLSSANTLILLGTYGSHFGLTPGTDGNTPLGPLRRNSPACYLSGRTNASSSAKSRTRKSHASGRKLAAKKGILLRDGRRHPLDGRRLGLPDAPTPPPPKPFANK